VTFEYAGGDQIRHGNFRANYNFFDGHASSLRNADAHWAYRNPASY
jgi:prepilin-type processing-associated H-X9-DG protein